MKVIVTYIEMFKIYAQYTQQKYTGMLGYLLYAILQMPSFKVWNRDRSLKYWCQASSLKELKSKGRDISLRVLMSAAQNIHYTL